MVTKRLLVFLVMVVPFTGFAQKDSASMLWNKLEQAIKKKQDPAGVYRELEVAKSQAWQRRDYFGYARAWNDQLRITDARTEDSLYLQNSAFIDSMLLAPATPVTLQCIMHLLQAKRLAAFYGKLAYRNRYYKTTNLPYKYSDFTPEMLDSTIRFHFEQAKKKLPAMDTGAVEQYLWLSADPLAFLFKPALYDIVQAEHIAFKTSFSRPVAQRVTKWLSLSAAGFMDTLNAVPSAAGGLGVFALYREWMQAHANDSASYLFIEALARKYIYDGLGFAGRLETIYENWLQQHVQSRYDPVKALAVYQLCLLWNKRAGNRDWTKDRFPMAKALELYEANKKLFADYAYLGKELEGMSRLIREGVIYWRMNNRLLPNEPLLAKLEYKNVDSLYYRIVPVGFNETISYQTDLAIRYLLNKPQLRSVSQALPAVKDVERHRSLLKLDPLPAGDYCILFAAHPLNGNSDEISIQRIRVSKIVMAVSDNRVYVLNAKTGRPLSNSKIVLKSKETNKRIEGAVNAQGFLNVRYNEQFVATVIDGNDTLEKEVHFYSDDLRADWHEMADIEDEDDLLEYYTDKTKLHILTDRSIYRPGQTVYFKCILTTRHPRTGKTIILNKENLQQGSFGNVLKKWLTEEEPEMYVVDPFNRKVDTIVIKPNAFGSVIDSFHIPVTAATGEWNFESDVLDLYSGQTTSFMVEEYKRPAFELKAEEPERTFLPGDTIVFKVKCRAFAGGSMAGTTIDYSISRTSTNNMLYDPLPEVSFDSVVQVDGNGMATLIFVDTALRGMPMPDSVNWQFRYELEATATDATGESHDIANSLEAASRPIAIQIKSAYRSLVSEFKPIFITTNDVNDRELTTDVKVKVFRTKDVAGNYQISYADYTDRPLYSNDQLQQWFPHIAFSEKSTPQQEVVFETTVKSGDSLRLPAGLLMPGNYTIEAACYDSNKLRGQQSKTFLLFDTAAAYIPDQGISFLHVPEYTLQPGRKVHVYMGTAIDSTYLLLQVKYYTRQHKKMRVTTIFREQLVKAGIHCVTFPVPRGAVDRLLITSLFVRNNEVYRQQQSVGINSSQQQPAIVIEQFRSKLIPGESATFTVSVKTQHHNVAAELMSTLYDATLDQLEKHHWKVPNLAAVNRLRNHWPNGLHSEQLFLALLKKPWQPMPNWNSRPVWWLQGENAVRYSRTWDPGNGEIDHVFLSLSGSVPGLTAPDAGLSEVIVVGYGTVQRNEWEDEPVKLPAKQEPVIKVRSNFNELAFFYPAVYADKDGYYRFTFTVPESLTEWNWKLLAHTKNAQFAYAEKKLQTQLPFMLQPNMPKALYQGDRLVLKSKISNLDTTRQSGKATIRVEDMVTGKDMTAAVVTQASTDFAVAPQASTIASFVLNVPTGQLNPLKVIIKALANGYGDGEEHIIPVLNNNVLVKQVAPFRLNHSMDTTIALPTVNNVYGVGLSVQPKPQAALINSLPYLANYSFDCAEQTFNKMLANATALHIMQTDSLARQYYKNASAAAGKQAVPVAMPAQLAEQSMPWLQLNSQATVQQQQLLTLFDTALAKATIHKHLEKLYSLQNADGGLCWFKGGKSNTYISAYVLAGFGRLVQQQPAAGWLSNEKTAQFIQQLITYIDATSYYDWLYTAYARSYWRKVYPLSSEKMQQLSLRIDKEWLQIGKNSLHHQALLIIVAMRWFENSLELYQHASTQLGIMLHHAINDPVNGMRWKSLADETDLTNSTEETLDLLTEAFEQTTMATDVQQGVAKWLLTAKTDHQWYSTKAAAAAIGLLQKATDAVTGANNTLQTTVNDQPLSVTNNLLGGQPFAFAKTAALPATVTVKKENNAAVQGNMITWYFTPASEISQLNKDIQLTKQLYRWNATAGTWERVGDSTRLVVSDKIKVELTIATSTNLPFVYIDDKTGGAFVSADPHSGYEYGDGFNYYRSVRDAGMQFFADLVPAGKTTLSYELTVAQQGSFTNGAAILQCLYKPEKVAYSNSMTIKTVNHLTIR